MSARMGEILTAEFLQGKTIHIKHSNIQTFISSICCRCSLSEALRDNTINIPPAKPLPGQTVPTPYVLVADDAFPIKPYIMKPFPFRNMEKDQRIYNYRLSRARRIVENVFGICAARFRILRRAIDVRPENVTTIVMAICSLHNFLITEEGCGKKDFDTEVDGVIIPGNWRQSQFDWQSAQQEQRGRANSAVEIRTRFMNYFSSAEGAVSWQDASINKQWTRTHQVGDPLTVHQQYRFDERHRLVERIHLLRLCRLATLALAQLLQFALEIFFECICINQSHFLYICINIWFFQ